MNLYFDLDGTLTDPAPGIVACIEHALRSLGREPQGDLTRFIGPPLRESFAEMLDSDDSELVEEAIRLYRSRFGSVGLYENSVYDGIPEALDSLVRAGYALRVVTSKAKVYADRIVDHFELRQFLPTVYGAELSGKLGEKAELIRHAMACDRVSPENVCMIGDRRYDILGAKANGVRAFGVSWGYGERDELREAGADAVIDRVEQLRAMGSLLRWMNRGSGGGAARS